MNKNFPRLNVATRVYLWFQRNPESPEETGCILSGLVIRGSGVAGQDSLKQSIFMRKMTFMEKASREGVKVQKRGLRLLRRSRRFKIALR
jgi:hypothetical protein